MMRMVMKMAAVSTISLLLLCSSAISSTDSQEVCDRTAAVGDNFTVPLLHLLDKSETLRWTHNKDIIFYRIGSIVVSGKKEDVSENGSLKLINLPKSKAGTYTPEINDKDGQQKGNLGIIRLCVFDRVPAPSVMIQCTSPSVRFTCKVPQQPKDVNFEWLQNDKVLEKEKGPTLTRVAKEVETDSFSCKVSNEVSSMTSKSVLQTCYKTPSLFPDKLFGINSWIVVGAGGGIVLVLIIVVIVCCICTKRRKRMQLKDEGELRLAWTSEQQHQHNHPPDHHHRQQHNHPPDQRHHHHHHHQQQPAGHTGPRQHRSKQHREQQRPRAPDHPNGHPQPSPRRPAQAPRPVNNVDEEQPPPLPQPRKKATKAPRV